MTDTLSESVKSKTEEAQEQMLPKRVKYKVLLRQLFLQASFNYERMQACGWLWALSPALNHIHKDDKKRLSESMQGHMDFFNTHPYLVTFMLGVVAAMEQSKQKVETIRSFKVAAMGPLGGIGDAMFNLTLKPIMAAIAASLAVDNVAIAPLFYLIALNVPRLAIQIPLFSYGYNTGIKALSKLKDQTVAMSKAATIVGITVIGAMSAKFVKLSTTASIGYADTVFSIQTDLLDKIVPNILPLLFVIATYKILMKGVSPTKIILGMIAFGVLGSYAGIL
ncbi:PTS system mannose/fructose/sorbose family transporter subunit IID [Vibrio sp. Hep-1b-8]|uniref:PTS system mannose/fructose/sorbose family transporter subunit IID n=1 Tax=Vibrio sp. Hep-1b-8 TaxID=2144187 RepID=UPI00111008D8|nr:PTS system mannose/fructose/sorbose family transporter subunit IID [Vibrio sp. Hep-1b-8]TMX44558.1 PTS sorbose transporter subunit IIB [Vibrio sp. Hep-1b-8]